MIIASELTFDERGLLPVIAQDTRTGDVLMLAWTNREAVEQTMSTRVAHFWSRSRGQLWRKGETSGNELHVRSIRVDCDQDALLYLVEPTGPACHTGKTGCFYRELRVDGQTAQLERVPFEAMSVLPDLQSVIRDRRNASDETSYTARLLREGVERIAKKVGEEAVEVCIAALAESDQALSEEAADLLYHLMVLFEARGGDILDALNVLRRRRASSDQLK